MADNFVLGIDAGGTFFKSGLVSEKYEVLLSSFSEFPVGNNKESIVNCYLNIIELAKKEVDLRKGNLVGIGVSIPGPFDYKNGISYMKHKLQSIYGISIRNTLYKKGVPESIPIRFFHDGMSFLLGEYIAGSAAGCTNIASVTLGTGVSLSIMKNGVLCKNQDGSTAFSIYNNPFHFGTVEDFLSRRGIIKLYKELSGSDSDVDVSDIELLAIKNNDPFAYNTFSLVGAYLAESIKDILIEQKVECLILGGQISKAFPLMEKTIKEGLSNVSTLKRIIKGNNLNYSTLIGVASDMFTGD